MASNNGSVFAWHARPAKIIQPLAPGFHEIERNIWYVEQEDEFEEPIPDEKEQKKLEEWENKNSHLGLVPLDERQRQLAQNDIDIERLSPGVITIANSIQTFAQNEPKHKNLDSMFKDKNNESMKNTKDGKLNIMSFIPVHVSSQDTYALMAKNNLTMLREKFNNLL